MGNGPSGADFTVNSQIVSRGAGIDATSGQVLSLQLLASPALDVTSCVYSVFSTSPGAPAPTIQNGGVATPPTAPVTLTLPPLTNAATYCIQCQTNGGAPVPNAQTGQPDYSVNTKRGVIAVRNVQGLRKLFVGESVEYAQAGWAQIVCDLVDAAGGTGTDAGAIASVSTAPGQSVALGPVIQVPSNSAWTYRATFTGKIVGPTTVVVFEQDYILQVENYFGALGVNPSLGGIDAASAWKSGSPTPPWSTTGGRNPLTVTAVADDGTGRCQLTVSGQGNLRQGSTVLVAGVTGANGPHYVDSINGNQIVLRGTSYSPGYISGGTVTVLGCVTLIPGTDSLQFSAQGLVAAEWVAGESVSTNDLRSTGGNVYLYTHGGSTHGSTPPTGTGTGIADGSATCDCLGPIASAPVIAWTLSSLKSIQM